MGRDNFDAVLASTPLNGTAGRVISQKGVHYEPEVNFADFYHWEAPPPTKPLPAHALKSYFINLTGIKFGRFTVVGYLGKLNPKKPALWLVRCACGDYEARTAKCVKSENVSEQACRKCLHWKTARKRYERMGPKAIEEFIS